MPRIKSLPKHVANPKSQNLLANVPSRIDFVNDDDFDDTNEETASLNTTETDSTRQNVENAPSRRNAQLVHQNGWFIASWLDEILLSRLENVPKSVRKADFPLWNLLEVETGNLSRLSTKLHQDRYLATLTHSFPYHGNVDGTIKSENLGLFYNSKSFGIAVCVSTIEQDKPWSTSSSQLIPIIFHHVDPDLFDPGWRQDDWDNTMAKNRWAALTKVMSCISIQSTITLTPRDCMGTLALDVYFTETMDTRGSLRDLLLHVWPESSVYDYTSNGSVRELEAKILPHDEPLSDLAQKTLQHSLLARTLFPFQKQAVAWMLDREGIIVKSDGTIQRQPYMEKCRDYTGLWQQVSTSRGSIIWINFAIGICSLEKPPSGYTGTTDCGLPISGGILAEEMGLGKTVELLALISMNRPSPTSNPPHRESCLRCCKPIDEAVKCATCHRGLHSYCLQEESCTLCLGETYRQVNPVIEPLKDEWMSLIPATLVVCPGHLMSQWSAEIVKHAPALRVFSYFGVKDLEDVLPPSFFANFDIVLVSYSTLRTELAYSIEDNQRIRRHERVYERRQSPLIAAMWWRIVLDEAQMVDTGASAAAEMVNKLDRVHAWAATGTPIHDQGLWDLRGLLLFLRHSPLYEQKTYKKMLAPVARLRSILMKQLSSLMRRNTKVNVGKQLQIPKQHQRVIAWQLSTAEKEYYQDVKRHALEQLSDVLDLARAASAADDGSGEWESVDDVRKGQMTQWLQRLRQTAIHPQVGAQNQMILGDVHNKIRSMDEVLEVLHAQRAAAASSAAAQWIQNKIRRGQALEKKKEFDSALKVYEDALDQVKPLLKEAMAGQKRGREEVDDVELNQVKKQKNAKGHTLRETGAHDNVKSRQIHWQEMYHRLLFFIASIHHSLKNEDLEDKFYKEADQVRQQVLKPRVEEVLDWQKRLKEFKVDVKAKVFPINLKGHLVIGPVEAVNDVLNQLNQQWKELMEWRGVILKHLMSPLEFKEDDKNPTGKEYEQGLDLQAIANDHQEVYGEALLDRKESLLGASFSRGDSEVYLARLQSDLARDLNKKRMEWKSIGHLPQLMNNLRNSIHERQMPKLQQELILDEINRLHLAIQDQVKLLDTLNQEKNWFTRVQNARIRYYAHLQSMSDDVQHMEIPDPDKELERCDIQERMLKDQFSKEKAQERYMSGLKDGESGVPSCIICLDTVSLIGVTPCGHFYCNTCAVQHFTGPLRRCGLCRSSVNRQDILWVANGEAVQTARQQAVRHSEILEKEKELTTKDTFFNFDNVACVSIVGSWGSKLDFLVKHLMVVKEKAIVFSQWDSALVILEQALKANNIGYTRPNASNGRKAVGKNVELFRNDPKVQVFLLHSHSQSSGLTLTHARHCFVLEPLVNVGVDQQAISRIHRFGQQRETYVWRYIMEDTIEVDVFDLHQEKLKALGTHGNNVSDVEAEAMGDLSSALKLKQQDKAAAVKLKRKINGSKGENVSVRDMIRLLQ